MKQYAAPWSTLLVVVSALSTIACLGAAAGAAWTGQGVHRWLALVPLVGVLGAALYCICGYAVTRDELLVRRLLWTTRLPLDGLLSVEFVPNAMRSSVRTFGNGGFFSFSGRYRNSALGSYRAFVTDGSRTVVLRFVARTVVISPAVPEAFVRDIAANPGRCP